MNSDEFIAAITAIHRYILDHAEKPIEVRRDRSYWKLISRIQGW